MLRALTTCTALAIGLAHGAGAQTLIDSTDVDAIREMARGYGAANIVIEDNGDPTIVGRLDGVRYVILFYGCSNGANCRDIQFRARWETDGPIRLELLNAWNRDWRFGKTYVDNEGLLVLEFDVNLYGGVSQINLDDTLDWWRLTLATLTEELLDRM